MPLTLSASSSEATPAALAALWGRICIPADWLSKWVSVVWKVANAVVFKIFQQYYVTHLNRTVAQSCQCALDEETRFLLWKIMQCVQTNLTSLWWVSWFLYKPSQVFTFCFVLLFWVFFNPADCFPWQIAYECFMGIFCFGFVFISFSVKLYSPVNLKPGNTRV